MNAHFDISLNELSIYIGGKQITAKIDSGAELNFMDKSFFDTLPYKIRKKLNKRTGICKAANDSEIKMLGDVVVPFEIRGQRVSARCYILAECNSKIFLGQPFLRQHKAALKFTRGVNILTLQVSAPVISTEFVIIPPYSEALIPGVALTQIQEKTTGYCFPFNALINKGILAAHMAVSVRNNTVPVRLYNSTSENVRIKKAERVATFRLFEGAEELLPEEIKNVGLGAVSTPSDKANDNKVTSKKEQKVPVDLGDTTLNKEQKEQLITLLKKYPDCFVSPPDNKLGLTDMAECKIETLPGTEPVSKFAYRQAPQMRKAMVEIIEEQVKQNLIEESNDGAWASPALLVKKASGGFRMVIDYRGLNAATIPQKLRIPRIDEVFDAIGEHRPKYFSVLDCTQGFHQVPLHPDSKEKTAFISPIGKFHYKTMPQGMRNSPAIFQNLMDKILRGIQFKYVMVYIDDICIFSATFEDHLKHIEEVLIRIRNAKLKLHPKKCKFAVQEVHYLGHILTSEGIKPNLDKIKAVRDCPVPKKLKQVRGFLGMAGYYRKFIRNFGTIARPLYNLTKKDVKFKWTDDCQEAFDKLKTELTSNDLLIFPNFEDKFYLATDASNGAIGACLSQKIDGHLRPIAYAGRSFNTAESKYNTTEQECLAVVWAIQHFKVYLECAETEVHTDHAALLWILKNKHSTGRLCRWALMLQAFNIEVKHIKGRENVVADQLSRQFYDYTRTSADEAIDNFPADLDNINVDTGGKTDDLVNSHDSEQTHANTRHVQVIESPTPPGEPKVFVPGTNEPAVPSLDALEKRATKFRQIMRDTAGKIFNDNAPNFTKEEFIKQQSIDKRCRVMIDFKQNNIKPHEDRDLDFVARKAEDYIIEDGVLLRMQTAGGRRPTAFATVVVPQNLKLSILKFMHDTPYGGHTGGQKMVSRMRESFFWEGMTTDVKEYVITCDICQAVKPTHRPIVPEMTEREIVDGAFQTLVIDAVGPLAPSRGFKHIVCVTDQYSRWCIAWPTASIDAESVMQDFNKHVICKFGAPKTLLCDNGPCFAAKIFKAMCDFHGIKLKHGSPFHPQSQGAVERAQQSLVSLIKAFCKKNQKNWADFIDEMIMALNNTESQGTGMIPFILVFGRPPQSPATLNIPEAYGDLPQRAAQKFSEYMARKEEGKQYAKGVEAIYRKKMKARYDEEKATGVKLQLGDCVWIRVSTCIVKGTARKMQWRYQGPFLIVNFVGPANVALFDVKAGKLKKRPIHMERLKLGHIRREQNNWDPINETSEDICDTSLITSSTDNTPTGSPLNSPDTSQISTPVNVNPPADEQSPVSPGDTHMAVYLHNQKRKVVPRVTRAMAKAGTGAKLSDDEITDTDMSEVKKRLHTVPKTHNTRAKGKAPSPKVSSLTLSPKWR